MIVGGVAANKRLSAMLQSVCKKSYDVLFASLNIHKYEERCNQLLILLSKSLFIWNHDGTQTIPTTFENFVYSDPEFSFERAVAVTAIEFPDKDSFERYSNWLFVGDYNNGRIYNFQLNSDRTGFIFYNQKLSDLVLDDNDEVDEILFAKGFQGVTDIKFHDGAMYVVSIGDGSIYKIYPKNILPPLK